MGSAKKDWHDELNVPDELVPSTTYFAVREDDNKIIGMVDIRHYLNDNLKESWNGHIGYSVRPDERRKGYATETLKLALKECEKRGLGSVILGCLEKNIGSKKTILNCGGEIKDESKHNDEIHLGFEIKLGGNKE